MAMAMARARIVVWILSVSITSASLASTSAPRAKQLVGAELQIPSSYRVVASRKGVPVEIIYSMALVESGKSLSTGSYRPYPWTLNVEGKPMRFDSKAEVVQHLKQKIQSGVVNIDVGFMQVNWHHHGHRFHSVESALDPWVNLRTGVQILLERLRSKKCEGNWKCAVGRYHSFREHDSRRYSAYVEQFYVQFAGGPL